MSLTKFNAKIQCKIQEGWMKKAPYVVFWAPTESKAIEAATALRNILGNRATVGLSRTIKVVGNEEIVSPNPKDFVDCRLLARYKDEVDEENSTDWEMIYIPHCKQDVTISELGEMLKHCVAKEDKGYNQFMSLSKYPVNVTKEDQYTTQPDREISR